MGTSKILMGGIYSHLIHMLTGSKSKPWSKGQFGGPAIDDRIVPYVILAKCQSRAWRSVTFDGEHHRLTLELMTGDNATLETTMDYSNDVICALNGADFDIRGHALIEIQHEQAEYIKIADKNAYLVRLLFTVLTVVD